MAKGKKKVIVYADWIYKFNELSDEEAGKLIKHFFRYINDENPEPPDRLTTLLFSDIKATLKRDLEKWQERSDKNKENALIRWNKNNANASERIQPNAKHADSDNDSVSDSDTVNNINNTFNKFVDEIKQGNHDSAIESMCRNNNIKRKDLNTLIKDFKDNLIIQDAKHKDTLEMRKHLANWLNKQNLVGKLDKFKERTKGML